jgi:hypothetical protein
MKNKNLYFLSFFICLFLITSCKNDDDIDSVAKPIVLPIIIHKYMSDSYVYGVGQATLDADLPDIVAVALDTVFGFEGGHGGKTGFDTVNILKSEMLSQPDLTKIGGSTISFEKFNKGGYKVKTSANVVIAGPIPDPGPTALEGTYRRTANGYLLEVKKVFDGVYIIGNPGGAASVPLLPYLLYNHANPVGGGDMLRFPVQKDLCGGGLRLVSPAAPTSLTAGEYSNYPPIISATSPLTLQWKVFEFPAASNSAIHPNGALCNWGHTAVRTFEKQ